MDFGQGLQIGGSGAPGFVCAGDTARDVTSPKLAYGTASEVAPFICRSRNTGVTCTRTTDGHGFFVSIQSYRFF